MHAIPNQSAVTQLLDDLVEAHRHAINEIRAVLKEAATLAPGSQPKPAANDPLSTRLRGALALLKYRPPRHFFPAPTRPQRGPGASLGSPPENPTPPAQPASLVPAPQSEKFLAAAQAALDDFERNPPKPSHRAATPARSRQKQPRQRPHPFEGIPAWNNYHLHPDYPKSVAGLLKDDPPPPWCAPTPPLPSSVSSVTSVVNSTPQSETAIPPTQ